MYTFYPRNVNRTASDLAVGGSLPLSCNPDMQLRSTMKGGKRTGAHLTLTKLPKITMHAACAGSCTHAVHNRATLNAAACT